jgi:uncharacterized ferritin-like protein (DUF455 family)
MTSSPQIHFANIHEFCRSVIESGDLEAKLQPPRGEDGGPLEDMQPSPSLFIDAPRRAPGLAITDGSSRLPVLHELAKPEARAICAARFAHHELMAIELFALALLRWPDAPAELRRGWLNALEEEQSHCQLFLERLHALDACLEDFDLSGYFLKHAPAILGPDCGPQAFLCAVGLTLEQANLDFSLVYEQGFRDAGDVISADVCRKIYEEEIGHVALALHWLVRLAPDGRSQLEAYRDAVPFPLGAHRAKARRFDAAGRRRAGLDEEFIAYVKAARPSHGRGYADLA